MPTLLTTLDEQTTADIADTDLLYIFAASAASDQHRKVTRATLLNGVARTRAEVSFTNITASGTLQVAGATTLAAAEVTGSLTLGAKISKILTGSFTVTLGDLAAGAAVTATATLTGLLKTDFLSVVCAGLLPDGMEMQAYPSAADTITFRFYNSAADTAAGAAYTMRALAVRTAA